MNRIKKYILIYYPIICIFLISLLYLHSLFASGLMMYGEEQGFLNYDFANYRFGRMWHGTEGFGTVSAGSPLVPITLGTLWKIGTLFNLSFIHAHYFFYFFIIFITTLFSYLSFFTISKNKILSLLASVCFITSYNYFVILTTSPKLIHFILLPLTLFFWLKYEQTKKSIFIILNTVFLYFLLTIAINPPQFLGAYSFIFLFILLFSLHKKDIKSIVLFTFPFLINILYVVALNVLAVMNSGHLFYYNALSINWASTSAQISDIFRLLGGWWDYAGAEGLLYNHLSDYYHSPLGVFFTFLPFLLLIYLLTLAPLKTGDTSIKETPNRIKTKVLAFIIIFIFLAKGSTPPFEWIFNTLFSKVFFFRIFREPWAKFIPNIIFALYVGIILLEEYQKRITKKIIYTALIIIIIFQSIPLMMNRVIDHRNIDWKLSEVKIPSYWEDIHKWSKKNLTDKRILVLPANIPEGVEHMWSPIPFRGRPEYYFLYSNTILDSPLNAEDRILLSHFFNNLSSDQLAINSIDYVLDKKDLDIANQEVTGIEKVESALDKKNRISFGLLDLYPVKPEYKTQKVRTLDKLYKHNAQDTSCGLDQLTKYKDYKTIAVMSPEHTIQTLPEVQQIPITLEKINTTNYKVTFSQTTTKDVGLLFVETYNKGWKLYSDNELNIPHYSANCFANLWIIPKDIVNNNQTIFIKYEPQTFLENLQYIYAIILIMYISYAVYDEKRRRILNKN